MNYIIFCDNAKRTLSKKQLTNIQVGNIVTADTEDGCMSFFAMSSLLVTYEKTYVVGSVINKNDKTKIGKLVFIPASCIRSINNRFSLYPRNAVYSQAVYNIDDVKIDVYRSPHDSCCSVIGESPQVHADVKKDAAAAIFRYYKTIEHNVGRPSVRELNAWIRIRRNLLLKSDTKQHNSTSSKVIYVGDYRLAKAV